MRQLFKRKPKAAKTVTLEVSGAPHPTFPVGIKLLYNGQSSFVDVVFVHGLTGNRDKTWTPANAEHPWPATLLPAKLPDTRILTFGYDAYVTDWRSVVSKNRIGHHAMNLLSDLAIYREKEDTNDKPIIFVCHSLGGLVCEDALNLSRQSPEKHLQKILSSTRGIIFLGTPQHGAGLADWARLLAQFIGLFKQTNPDILGVLKQGSEILERIQNSFFEMIRTRDQQGFPPIQITSFAEELPLPGIGIVVPRESATLPGYVNLSIRQNHVNMTKFTSDEDDGFIKVVGQLDLWMKALRPEQIALDVTAPGIAVSPKSLTTSEKRYLTSLGPSTFLDIDEQILGTCTWMTEVPQYKSWNEDHESAILWLTGTAGCGKTVLTNFLVESICQQKQSQSNDRDTILCSFFCARDRETHHDIRSLLKNLIWQILTNAHEVVRHIKALFGSSVSENDPSFETLWRIFKEVIHRVSSRHVYVIIDALDECDDKWRGRFLSRLTQIMIAACQDGLYPYKKIRVLFSGQPHIRRQGSPMPGFNQYHVDLDQRPDGLMRDIQNFIRYKVEELVNDSICSESTGTTLRLALESMSENSFLWLRIVVEHIRNSLRYRDADVLQLLSEVPRDLQQAYAAYLPDLPASEVPLLRKYLKLIVACYRPLTIAEVDSFANVESQPFQYSEHSVVKSSVRRALGPLVKFPNDTVQLVHSTAKEYLILLQLKPDHRRYASHGIDPTAAHLYCAKACMEYLTKPAVNDLSQGVTESGSYGSSPITPRATRPKEEEEGMLADLFDIEDVGFLKDPAILHAEIFGQLIDHFKAYDYAARYWTSHFAQSQHVADEATLNVAVELLTRETDAVGNWYQYVAHVSRLDMPSQAELDAVVLAALFGHTRSLRVLLDRGTYAPDNIRLQQASYWAASRGNSASVAMLMEYGVRLTKVAGAASLSVAIQGAHSDVCGLLLNDGKVDPNEPDHDGRPPLALAAALNHSTVLHLLLQQPTIQIDRLDHLGRTALMAACVNKAEECTRALLDDQRSNYNLKSRHGYTPLHHAAEHGCDFAVKGLLALPDVEIGDLTATGRNALSLAAQQGHISIVRRLCHNGLTAVQKDHEGRNAISWASHSLRATNSGGTESVLQYLVRKFPDAADDADNDGWTPLAWALDPPGYRDSVDILLRSGHVNVNHCDQTEGRSILAWAASYGHLEIVQLLLKVEGIKKNSVSFDGRTALSYAATTGTQSVVEVLLQDEEVLRELPDNVGRVALDWARLNRHDAVVNLLQESARHTSSS